MASQTSHILDPTPGSATQEEPGALSLSQGSALVHPCLQQLASISHMMAWAVQLLALAGINSVLLIAAWSAPPSLIDFVLERAAVEAEIIPEATQPLTAVISAAQALETVEQHREAVHLRRLGALPAPTRF